MAKRNRGLSDNAIRKRRRRGYGSGEGAGYKPWLTIQDVPSKGQVNRCYGWKTGRAHHLMSRNELRYFYLLEWSPLVTDIREQFPLWPYRETQEIAREFGVEHPTPPGGGTVVMTSDFRITFGEGKEAVRTVKESAALDDERALQKLDIEREYWHRRGVDWGVVIAEDIPLGMVENIEWMHPYFGSGSIGLEAEDLPTVARYLTDEVLPGGDALANIARRCDDHLGLARGTCLALAHHLLATRRWQTDMSTRINPARPLVVREVQEV